MDSTRRARYPRAMCNLYSLRVGPDADARTDGPGHDGGDMDPEPDTFIVWHGVCGPSSPFRRRTTAHEEFGSYFHARAVQRASAASASASNATTRRRR
jgi:hypothetical protein